MRSLIAIGDDLSQLPGLESSSGLRATWLTVVNSLLTMDQATKLAPLIDHAPRQRACIDRFKAVPGTLEYILQLGAALWWQARQDERFVRALAGPVMAWLASVSAAGAATREEGGAAAREDAADDERPLDAIWRVKLNLLAPPTLSIFSEPPASIEIDSSQLLGALWERQVCRARMRGG